MLVLDTVKKVADIMDKRTVAEFTRIMRRFGMKGGTVIALAHTNKHPRPDGSPVYAGTTDLRDDFDCAYTLQDLPTNPGTTSKYVELRNIKRRGDVAEQVVYTYTPSGDYLELLSSTRRVPDHEMVYVKQQACAVQDADLIELIRRTIQSGKSMRMELVSAVRKEALIPRAEVLRVLDRYTGDDRTPHRWSFTVEARGANVYHVLERDG